MKGLPDIVSGLQTGHEFANGTAAFDLVMVAARPANSTRCPISPVRSIRIRNNAGNVQISTRMQPFHVVIDDRQQLVSVDDLARHFHLRSALGNKS
ncbi:hypothetical protein [Burkholderia vietnamiensis]|uniref:hypothetical protein n=1 Tax=Burkholderia vietnamiensis TaxID=60552 RepID=UPI00265510F4|nr:hypothetical protein [Burkholderia vietnamiensis]MDN7814628.1 hypothetical protein [Burkholderia vietnamiensis]